jgi:hypothetical protein
MAQPQITQTLTPRRSSPSGLDPRRIVTLCAVPLTGTDPSRGTGSVEPPYGATDLPARNDHHVDRSVGRPAGIVIANRFSIPSRMCGPVELRRASRSIIEPKRYGGSVMFASALSDQQVTTLYFVGAFLVVAPIALGLAALLGFVHRVSRPTG